MRSILDPTKRTLKTSIRSAVAPVVWITRSAKCGVCLRRCCTFRAVVLFAARPLVSVGGYESWLAGGRLSAVRAGRDQSVVPDATILAHRQPVAFECQQRLQHAGGHRLGQVKVEAELLADGAVVRFRVPPVTATSSDSRKHPRNRTASSYPFIRGMPMSNRNASGGNVATDAALTSTLLHSQIRRHQLAFRGRAVRAREARSRWATKDREV